MSSSLWPHGLQHTGPPCPSPIPGVYSNSCPLSRWCHPTISSSVNPLLPPSVFPRFRYPRYLWYQPNIFTFIDFYFIFVFNSLNCFPGFIQYFLLSFHSNLFFFVYLIMYPSYLKYFPLTFMFLFFEYLILGFLSIICPNESCAL